MSGCALTVAQAFAAALENTMMCARITNNSRALAGNVPIATPNTARNVSATKARSAPRQLSRKIAPRTPNRATKASRRKIEKVLMKRILTNIPHAKTRWCVRCKQAPENSPVGTNRVDCPLCGVTLSENSSMTQKTQRSARTVASDSNALKTHCGAGLDGDD